MGVWRPCVVLRDTGLREGDIHLAPSSQFAQVELHGILQAEEERITDQCMADGHFQQAGNMVMEECKVRTVQIMAGIDT